MMHLPKQLFDAWHEVFSRSGFEDLNLKQVAISVMEAPSLHGVECDPHPSRSIVE